MTITSFIGSSSELKRDLVIVATPIYGYSISGFMRWVDSAKLSDNKRTFYQIKRNGFGNRPNPFS
ncbi:hypothetical protein [Lysinibacillus cavernae]|uniref:hypothetical protein n=1 Tax=Lysinibacillus cavernae TaxID=2666135 RepID=UPI0012D8D10A|nr:hypothetical protein [Lysinibacillus cavernae]